MRIIFPYITIITKVYSIPILMTIDKNEYYSGRNYICDDIEGTCIAKRYNIDKYIIIISTAILIIILLIIINSNKKIFYRKKPYRIHDKCDSDILDNVLNNV